MQPQLDEADEWLLVAFTNPTNARVPHGWGAFSFRLIIDDD